MWSFNLSEKPIQSHSDSYSREMQRLFSHHSKGFCFCTYSVLIVKHICIAWPAMKIFQLKHSILQSNWALWSINAQTTDTIFEDLKCFSNLRNNVISLIWPSAYKPTYEPLAQILSRAMDPRYRPMDKQLWSSTWDRCRGIQSNERQTTNDLFFTKSYGALGKFLWFPFLHGLHYSKIPPKYILPPSLAITLSS